MGMFRVSYSDDRCLRAILFSTMAGKPFKVGRFAHTLRVRLMREHLGVDVDAMYEVDLMAKKPQEPEFDQQPWDPDQEEREGHDITHVKEKRGGVTVGAAVGQGKPSRVRFGCAFCTDELFA